MFGCIGKIVVVAALFVVAGATAYVSKPFRFKDLLVTIEAQLKG